MRFETRLAIAVRDGLRARPVDLPPAGFDADGPRSAADRALEGLRLHG